MFQLTGINMFVGISGQPGKPMLRESRGLQVTVQRPLRDLFKKVPELAIDVQVWFLTVHVLKLFIGAQWKAFKPIDCMTDKEHFCLYQVPLLSGAMTHKEYLVIIDCASTNFSEEPNLPPTFREPPRMSEISDEEKLLLEMPGEPEDEKASTLSRNIDPVSAASVYTKIRITVDVRQVELDLYIGLESETSLARLEVRY